MPRLRLGVVLLVPAPIDREIDALRRAVGDGTYGRVPAHLTLVPPVNVREGRLGEALAVLRNAAAATGPFTISLGPPATFLPDNPTLYLSVADDVGTVHTLRDRVFLDPLARPLTWPFVPHVTLADEADPGRIDVALAALADYRVDVTFRRLHLLREGAGRVWTPIADVELGVPAVIGRGGLPVELTVSELVDPEAQALSRVDGTTRIVVTARADDAVAGYAEGWCRRGEAHLSSLTVGEDHLHLGVGRHLLAAFRSEAASRGCPDVTVSPGVGATADVG